MTAGSLGGLRIAVFGIGEAGSAIAADLVRHGASVVCFDPAAVADVPGASRVRDPRDAVASAGLVLAVTPAADARRALDQAIAEIEPTAVYADLSTASAGRKRELAGVAAARGLAFADVALMSTVPDTGLFTPALASGPGAGRYVELLAPAGAPVEAIGTEAGMAATRKLLRSVVVKGMAAVVIEAMRAAELAELADETWANLVDELTATDEAFLRRLVSGTGTHAVRRLHEMEACADLLTELGVDPVMTRATVENLRRVPDDGLPELPG